MFLNGKNPFSSSAASRAIVAVFLCFWFICLIFSFNEFISLFDFSKNNAFSCYFIFIFSLAIIADYLTDILRGSPHKTKISDFSLTIRRPEILSTLNSNMNSNPAFPATSHPDGTTRGCPRPQSPSSRSPYRPAVRPRFPARLPRCRPSRSPHRAA